jgi:hypothetical protein
MIKRSIFRRSETSVARARTSGASREALSAPHQPSTPAAPALNPRIASRFLAHLRRTGDVSVAADLTGMDRTTLYYYQQRDP